MHSLVLTFLFASTIAGSSQQQQPLSAEGVYDACRGAIYRLLPRDFIADLNGPSIKKRLDEIPDAAILNGKRDSLKVRFFYLKSYEPRVLVSGVDPVFRGRFSRYLSFMAPWVSFSQAHGNYKKFIRRYRWAVNSKDPFHVYTAHRDRSDFYELFFSKRWLLDRVLWKNSQSSDTQVTVKLNYEEKGSYFLPVSIEGKGIRDDEDEEQVTTLRWRFNNFKINYGLELDDLLDDDRLLEIK